MARWPRWVAMALALAALTVACAAFDRALIHFLGIDTQESDNYDFFSGSGPFILTALGQTTIIAGLWHHVNCHEPGCLLIGRHKVDGTPWCNRHHENARAAIGTDELLRQVVARLDRLLEQRE